MPNNSSIVTGFFWVKGNYGFQVWQNKCYFISTKKDSKNTMNTCFHFPITVAFFGGMKNAWDTNPCTCKWMRRRVVLIIPCPCGHWGVVEHKWWECYICRQWHCQKRLVRHFKGFKIPLSQRELSLSDIVLFVKFRQPPTPFLCFCLRNRWRSSPKTLRIIFP